MTEEEKTAAPITSDDIKQSSEDPFVSIGEKLFTWRDYTPIPLIFLVLFTAEPSVRSATIGTLIIMAGELLRIYSVAFIGSVSRTRNTTSAGANLITSGPFSWMRNPLYVGNFLITLGIAVFGAVSWVVLIAVLAFAFQYHCIVKYEEELLKKKFGQTYMTYMQDVPAWLPNKTPSLEGLEWPDTFTPALKSEKRTLSAVAIMLLALVLLGS